MNPSIAQRLSGVLLTVTLLAACQGGVSENQAGSRDTDSVAADPPNEQQILVEELAHIAERSVLY